LSPFPLFNVLFDFINLGTYYLHEKITFWPFFSFSFCLLICIFFFLVSSWCVCVCVFFFLRCYIYDVALLGSLWLFHYFDTLIIDDSMPCIFLQSGINKFLCGIKAKTHLMDWLYEKHVNLGAKNFSSNVYIME